jgi:AraC-like DNA-binding protein
MLGEDHFKLRLARLQPSEQWVNQSRNEDEFTFVFIKGGFAKYVFPNATQRIVSGNILVFTKHSVGKLYAEEKSECVFATFSLLFEHLFPLFGSNEIGLLHNVMANFKAGKIFSPGSAVAVECQPILEIAYTQPRLQQRSQLLRIVAAILADEFKNVHTQRSGMGWAEDHMIQVFEKLSSSELLKLSVDELASKFSCSRRHLNRLFHQHFGLSITALRMEIRLLKAVSLLRNPREKVINVAEQCGFNHLGLFNTCFKKRYGTSPGQWRKLALGGSDNPSGRKNEGKPSCPLHANGLCPWGGQPDAFTQPAKGPASAKIEETVESSASGTRREAAAGISQAAAPRGGTSRTQPGRPA